MTRASLASLTAAVFLALGAGCDPEDGDSSPDSEPPDTSSGCSSCELLDTHSASLQSSLQAESVALVEGSDARLDWGELQTDMLGRVDPQVQEAWLFVFPSLSEEDILQGLAEEALSQSEVSTYMTCTSPKDTCTLSEFVILGHYLVPSSDFLEGTGSWLIALQGTEGQGLHSLAFIRPESDDASAGYSFSDGSAALEAAANFTDAAPLQVAPGVSLELDWSSLTQDPWGREIALSQLDRLALRRFDQTPEDLQERVLELDDLALESWELTPGGSFQASLSDLQGDSEFTGIDAESTWLLGLYCSTCNLPLPHALVVLEAP